MEDFPDYVEYIAKIADEFRELKQLQDAGKPYTCKTRVAVLHFWGSMRSWSLSGHFHETYMHDLIHINEALSGLPLEVSFISFEDVKAGALEKVDVVINAGAAGSAWSGADAWKDEEVIARLTKWVWEGGTFIGVGEPSAVPGYDSYFRMAHVLGVDEDIIDRVCHGKWAFEVDETTAGKVMPEGAYVPVGRACHLTDGKATVLAAQGTNPLLTRNTFGRGRGRRGCILSDGQCGNGVRILSGERNAGGDQQRRHAAGVQHTYGVRRTESETGRLRHIDSENISRYCTPQERKGNVNG